MLATIGFRTAILSGEGMVQRILAIIKKETVQMLRDRVTLGIALLIPIIQIILFGFAISMNVRHLPTVVADQSMDAASRAYLNSLVNSQYFDIVETLPDQAAVKQAIDDNQAQVGVVIPPDFAEKVSQGQATALIMVDGSEPFVSLAAYSNANIVAQQHAVALVTDQLTAGGSASQVKIPLLTSIRILYNPDLHDLWFVIPGLIALILQVQSIVLVVSAIVREREMGTIEQILVTPIHPAELLVGKMIPVVVLLGLNLAMVLAIAIFGFHVPFQGSLLVFVGLVLIYVFACVGLGLLISTVSENQIQAFQLNMMITLVALVVSGFIFPRNSLPPVVNQLGYLFPLTYFIPIARGVISKGIGLEILWPMAIVLLFYAVLIVFIASKTFKQKID
jgi:ABC-2 type transport system permease protein